MRHRHLTTLAAPAMAAVLVLASSAAFGDESSTPLLKTPLKGMDGMEANIMLVEVPPGFQTERHLHPGHVFLYVLEGAIEVALEGREPLRLAAGDAGYEIPNTPMVGRNLSATEGARFVIMQIGPAGEPLTVPQ